uniref:DUF659 domain-containing protein n=1 Tax=Strongyloides papillosus TaxID=174720 RepID=A0A0N5CIM9_STREA
MATSNPIIKAKIMIYDTKAAIIHCSKCEAVYQPTTSSSIWYKHAMKHEENVVKMKDLINYKTFCNKKKPRIQFNKKKSENSFTLTKDVSMRKTTELERNLALFIASHNLPINILENQLLPKIVGDSNAMIPSVVKMTKIIMPSIANKIREKVITTSLKHGNMISICFDETSNRPSQAKFKKITTSTSSIELSKSIMDLIEPFKEINILSATTDGATNARKCATFFVKNDNDTYHCGAHLIKLVVQNSMVEKELANICCKVSSLVK